MRERSEFFRKHEAELKSILNRYKKWLLDDIMPFWDERVVDPVYGGYFNCFDRTGRLEETHKVGWFVGRDMYTYSLLYNEIEKRPEWMEIASIGRKYLNTQFAASNYHFNQMLTQDGKVIKGFNSIFTDHFVAKGLFEYAKATNLFFDRSENVYIKAVTDQLFKDVKDPEILHMERVKPGTIKHAINFMTLIVALESEKVFGSTYLSVMKDCMENILYKFANDDLNALLEVVNDDGTLHLAGLGRIFDAGHSMESCWFTMSAAERIRSKKYFERAMEILDWVWEKAYDSQYGGFFTQVDAIQHEPLPDSQFEMYTENHKIMWDDKIWWTHAEAIASHIIAALYAEDEKMWNRFCVIDDYVTGCFKDSKYGEWFSVLNRDGDVKYDCKGFDSKGPYHVPRCMVVVIRAIEKYLKGELQTLD